MCVCVRCQSLYIGRVEVRRHGKVSICRQVEVCMNGKVSCMWERRGVVKFYSGRSRDVACVDHRSGLPVGGT